MVWLRVETCCKGKDLVATHSGHTKLTKENMNMNRDSQKKEGAKANGKRRMSNEEFDKEMIELKVQLNYVEQLLQKRIDENHRGLECKEKGQVAYCEIIYQEIDAHD
jgi:AAA15 family ATPase/GTPase